MKVLVVGSNGRESALAAKLEKEATVFAIASHRNPSIDASCIRSGGELTVGDHCSPEVVLEAARRFKVDLVLVSSDNPLEAGVIDAIREAGIPAVGPTRAGAEIEWNKSYARKILYKTLPEYAPRFWIIKDSAELAATIALVEKEQLPIVVKPAGLTGGKGVKVMGQHLADYRAAHDYAAHLMALAGGAPESVVLEEKIEGVEFTVQALTDGKKLVRVPATFDHPYRYDNDTGPGTGGMGSYSDKGELLPFITKEDYDTCLAVTERVLEAVRAEGRHFSGTIYAGFFKTKHGLKVIEFNARFGDPECINIMAVLDSSLLDLLTQIQQGRLDPSTVRFKQNASVTTYLVSPDYALREGQEYLFEVDTDAIAQAGAQVLFSSAVKGEGKNGYKTVGNSRCLAIAALADTIPEAAAIVQKCCATHVRGPLQYRKDIGSAEAIQKLLGQLR